MKIFPAIDILNGRCVRLLYGDKNRVTDYGDPVDMAVKFWRAGAQYLHIVDLSAAFDHTDTVNYDTIKRIAAAVEIPFQLGGGVRDMDGIRLRLEELGAARVILGTVAYSNPALLKEAAKAYGKRIVVGMDTLDGRIAVKGWTQTTEVTAEQMGSSLKELGIEVTVVTDISRDGALTGVNAAQCRDITAKSGIDVIASGGVKDINDIIRLKEYGVYGAILGRSLYEGTIDLEDAIKEQD